MQSKITWKQCADLPIAASRGQTIVINNKVYYGGFEADSLNKDKCMVYCYDSSQDTWNRLPPLGVKWFGLGQVRGQLVAVGGQSVPDWVETNEVYVFDEREKKWKGSFPSMPTARHSSVVLSYPSALVVAGGRIGDFDYIESVDIFNTETSRWYRTDKLPNSTPCHDMSPVVVGDTSYLLGSGLNQVFCASVDQLLHNATPPNQAPPNDTQDHVSAWKKLADTPNYVPTAAVMADTVLSIGGTDKSLERKSQSSVHMYSPSTDSWIHITDLPAPRYDATTAVLSPTEILVIGGVDDNCRQNTVYKGTLSVSL